MTNPCVYITWVSFKTPDLCTDLRRRLSAFENRGRDVC